MIANSVENFKKQYDVAVAKIDTDKADQLSVKFDIHVIPTYILLKKAGGEVEIVEFVASAHI